MTASAYYDDADWRIALAIYGEFVRRSSGALKPLRNDDGSLLRDHNGKVLAETPEEAVQRRFASLPDAIRLEFLGEARAARMVLQ